MRNHEQEESENAKEEPRRGELFSFLYMEAPRASTDGAKCTHWYAGMPLATVVVVVSGITMAHWGKWRRRWQQQQCFFFFVSFVANVIGDGDSSNGSNGSNDWRKVG